MATQIIRAEEQERIFGGGNDILEAGCYEHDWQYTGNEKEGWFFFWTKHEKTGLHQMPSHPVDL